jgi:hypothetical protein
MKLTEEQHDAVIAQVEGGVSKCRCGKPTHPCYGSRCEDCFVDAYPIFTGGMSYRLLSYNSTGLGGYLAPGLQVDRRWNRTATQRES